MRCFLEVYVKNEQLGLFGGKTQEFDDEPSRHIKVHVNDIILGDRLFYKIGNREHYGTVIDIIDNHKFFKVEDLSKVRTIHKSQIVQDSPHRWIYERSEE